MCDEPASLCHSYGIGVSNVVITVGLNYHAMCTQSPSSHWTVTVNPVIKIERSFQVYLSLSFFLWQTSNAS